MKGRGLMDLARRAKQKMLRRPEYQRPVHEQRKHTPSEREKAAQERRAYERAARTNRRDRRTMLGRPAGKGIVGYQTNAKAPRYPPLQFQGKDHSERPAYSTKRLGRPRGPGGGGRGGELRRLKEMEERG